jgi:ectoine hydroxylase-related dioxygenase (phytanoyl-CoA dioxygenase family)
MKGQLPIFKDTALQEQFDRDGYVKMKLLNADKADELYRYFIAQQNEHDVVNGLYQSTTHTNNPDLIRKVDEQIKSVLLPQLGQFFQNYEPMMATYITKQPGPGSDTILHQDPNFVDEQRFISANVWVALHDIDHENGNLFFVRGTHRFIQSLRVTPDCPTAFDDIKPLLSENIFEVPVKKGEAIFINHAVVHGATPNLSESPRIAAVLALRSAGSEWIYHYLERGAPHNQIEKYEVTLDSFITLEKDQRPKHARFAGNISWNFPQLSKEDFIKGTKIYSKEKPFRSLLNRLAAARETLLR